MTVAIYDKNILLLKSKCQVDIKVRKFTMFIAAVGPRTKVFSTQFSLLGSQSFSTLEEKCRISARSCMLFISSTVFKSSKKLLEMARHMLSLVNKVKKTLIYRA